MTEFVRRHPKVLTGGALLLVGFAAWNLVGAIDLYHRAQNLVGDMQRDVSESLGG